MMNGEVIDMPSICLTKEELIDLTTKKQAPAQARVLAELGIPFKRRPDGSILVLRADIEQDVQPTMPKGPDFSSLRDGTEAA